MADAIRILQKQFPEWRFMLVWVTKSSGPDYCTWVAIYEEDSPVILKAMSADLLRAKLLRIGA